MNKRNGFQEACVAIYVLTDLSGNVFYVGCTIKSLEARLKMHLSEAKRNKPYTNKVKNEKIRSLNYKVIIKQVDQMIGSGFNGYQINTSAHHLEKYWMVKFYSMGCALTNGKDLEMALKSVVK